MHLIIVCCHAIWLGGPSQGHTQSEWLIAPFQNGETPLFIAHIRAGLSLLSEDLTSHLVFSGGPTKSQTKTSEAQSYASLAEANSHFNYNIPDLHERIHIEDRALDSYHNVLFSLTLAYHKLGVWADKVTIISHGFKKRRIVDGHCAAIGLVGVEYLGGVNNDDDDVQGMNMNGQEKGVEEAVGEWEDDPHGRGDKLKGKRKRRNPWGVWQGVWKDKSCENRGGLVTTGEGTDETLVEDGERPWL